MGVNEGLNANLDFRMTKQSFAKGAAKTIPVVSAVISGGLTFATFPPMAKRLQKHLADLALAKPCGYQIPLIRGSRRHDHDLGSV